jgi:hypothetical protein
MIELDRLEIADDQLVIDYRVTPPGPSAMYLFDRFWELTDDGFSLLDYECYRHFEGSRLHLIRAIQPIPPGMKAEAPEAPYASRLEPGQSGARRIVVPVPVARFSAYTGLETSETVGAVTEIVLSLGYVLKDDIPLDWAVVTPVPALGEGLFRTGGMALEMQKTYQAALAVPEGLSGYLDG